MTVLLAIGTRKGLWLARSADRTTWELEGPHFPAVEVASVLVDVRTSPPRIVAGLKSDHYGPSLRTSDDLGRSWDEAPGLTFPEDTGVALERVWQLQPDVTDPDVVWAGAEPWSLWRSADRGARFELVRALWDHPHKVDWQPGGGGAALHTVLPQADRVVVAMSTGGVYVSPDGMTDWQARSRGIAAPFMPEPQPDHGQCVHKVAVDASGPDRMYAQNHGGVYRTDDGGVSWTSIAEGLPSDFGFPVLASPTTPGTAWVVPLQGDFARLPPEGRLRAHRTRDAGASWTAVGDGLPDACWASVLRDAACVDQGDPTGVYLGTRDGCVYASADEGDTFTEVAAHLPDVLVVRAVELP